MIQFSLEQSIDAVDTVESECLLGDQTELICFGHGTILW